MVCRGLTNWKEREVKVDFSFLSEGEYNVVLFRDGINSDLVAKDYKKETLVVNRMSVADVKMYSGGGFIMKVTKKIIRLIVGSISFLYLCCLYYNVYYITVEI